MNERDFCYWLQGFVELTEADNISPEQWQAVKDHLKLVFEKKTPVYHFEPDAILDIETPVSC